MVINRWSIDDLYINNKKKIILKKMESILVKTPFDNDVSMGYKYAAKNNLPYEYVVKIGHDEFTTYPAIIENLSIKNGYSLTDIYDAFLEEGYELNPVTIGLIYAGIMTKKGIDVNSLIEELNEFNDIQGTKENYSSETDLNNAIKNWRDSVFKSIKMNKANVEHIENIHTILSKVQNDVKTSPIVINSMMIRASPIFDHNIVRYIEDIFDNAVVSEILPYVQFNTPGNNLIKLYKGDNIDNNIDYDSIIHKKEQTNELYKLYFTLWVGKQEEIEIDKANKKSMTHGYYDTDKNILEMETIIKEQSGLSLNYILTTMSTVLPIREYEKIETTHIKGVFMVFGIEINDYSFIHMVLNDRVLSEYFFVDETSYSYAEKVRISVRYKSTKMSTDKFGPEINYLPSSLNVTINQEYTKESSILTLYDPVDDEQVEMELDANTPYLEVKISRASSMDDINDFIHLFTYLLSYYKEKEQSVMTLYKRYIPELNENKTERKNKTKGNVVQTKPVKNKRTKDKLNKLRIQAPEIFVTGDPGYARICQSKHQPTLIDKNEIEKWKNDNKQVMAFPSGDNPEYYFGCEDNVLKYPGAARNSVKNSNFEKYPCLPCCYKKDQINDKNSTYNTCNNIDKIEDIKLHVHQMKGDKALGPGRTGLITSDCSKLISLLTNSDEKKINRYGVPFSVNSILHSIFIAKNDDNYIELTNDKDREEFVREYRANIKNIKGINISLLKQEFYNYTEKEIWNFVNEVDTFFDTRWYYRLLEELFDVNIYVFTKVSETQTKFEIPNFRIFPVKLYRKRPIICIYKTEGTKTQLISVPQYELICVTKDKTRKFIFSEKYSEEFYDAYINCVKIISYTEINKNEFQLFNNLYNIDLTSYTKGNEKSQIIDAYGKLRAIIFTIDDNEEATIFSLPSEPLNLPSTNTIKLASVKNIIKLMGNPTSIVTNSKSEIEGLWYDLNEYLKNAIFIPVEPFKSEKLQKLPEGKPNPYVTTGQDIITKNIKLKRDLECIYQLVEWLFTFKPDFDTFIQKYITYPKEKSNHKVNSDDIYDFSKLNVLLPEYNNIGQAIKYISKNTKGFIKNGKIYLYTQKFAEGVLYHLKRFIKYNDGFDWNNIRMERIRYQTLIPDDFNVPSNVALFLHYNELQSWLETKSTLSIDKLTVIDNILNNNIDDKLTNRIDPYMYDAANINYYIIQNVKDNDIARALNISINWRLNKINLGYDIKPLENIDDISYIIYEPIITGEFVILEDHSLNEDDPHEILDYGKNRYATMLRLPDIE